MRLRLRGAAIVKLHHLMKTSILRLNELHPLQQTAAQAGGGGLYFPSMCPVILNLTSGVMSMRMSFPPWLSLLLWGVSG